MQGDPSKESMILDALGNTAHHMLAVLTKIIRFCVIGVATSLSKLKNQIKSECPNSTPAETVLVGNVR